MTKRQAKPAAADEQFDQDLEAGQHWLTPEIRDLLAAIAEPHASKKRYTVIAVAFAKANQTPIAAVFSDPRACHERNWWGKWQYIPEIKAALEACTARAREYTEATTADQLARFRRERLIETARWAAAAPAAMAEIMADKMQRGESRINAALKLIALDTPAADGGPAGTFTPIGGAGIAGDAVITEVIVEMPRDPLDDAAAMADEKRETRQHGPNTLES